MSAPGFLPELKRERCWFKPVKSSEATSCLDCSSDDINGIAGFLFVFVT